MTVNLLVAQLHFARDELKRGLDGVSDNDGRQRFLPMNCISWMVGHLADQENRYWVNTAQNVEIHPELNELVGSGKPASTPALSDMWMAWEEITNQADQFLNTLSSEGMREFFVVNDRQLSLNIGTMLLRNIYHYWFHIGEAMAVRQMLGHQNLPQFVGDMSTAKYG